MMTAGRLRRPTGGCWSLLLVVALALLPPADLEAELEPAQLGDGHLGRFLRLWRWLGGALSPALLLLIPVVAGLLSVAPPPPPMLARDQVQLLEALAERSH